MPEKVVEVAGEELIARADGSLYWPRNSTLLVADVHFGKAASFRAAAVPVPVGTTEATLNKLQAAIDATSPARLAFLGDLYHSKEGRRDQIFSSLGSWRRENGAVDMVLVEGNHDRKSGELPAEIGIRVVGEPFDAEPFAMCHYPCEIEGRYSLSGHIHPAVQMRARGRQTLRLPCFWFGEHCAVLPAFGEFTGTAVVEPRAGDRVLVLAEDLLHDVSRQVAAVT